MKKILIFVVSALTLAVCAQAQIQFQPNASLKKNLAKISEMTKEITLYTDKAADAEAMLDAYRALYKKLALNSAQIQEKDYYRQQVAQRRKYYLANPQEISFANEPNAEDKLVKNWDKLLNKQMKLETKLREFIDKKMYPIDKKDLELKARYWAGCILNDKDVTYDELNAYSKYWVMDDKLTEKLMKKIKTYVDKGFVKPLSESERERFDEDIAAMAALLHAGSHDTELINSLSQDYCIDIMAAYWADHNERLPGEWTWPKIENALKHRFNESDKIFARSKEMSDKNQIRYLSPNETYAVNACEVKMALEP